MHKRMNILFRGMRLNGYEAHQAKEMNRLLFGREKMIARRNRHYLLIVNIAPRKGERSTKRRRSRSPN